MISLEGFRQYRPPGPVAAAFLRDKENFVRAIRGPVGGGKSSTCVFDLIKNACEMPEVRDAPPPGVDGVIRFKVAVIGQTYGQLERNLFPTWKRWLPADGANWTDAEFTGGGGRMASHKVEWDIVRGNRKLRVYFEAIFAAIGEHVVEEFMRGFEPTCFWLYEVDLLPDNIIDQAIFRLGRYPAVADLKPTTPLRGFPGYTLAKLPPGVAWGDLPQDALYRSYIICDLNSPDVDSWFYKKFEEDCPKGFKQYVQPGGRSPNAENLHNLPPGYYDRQISVLKDKSLVKRMVDNEYAPSRDGEPVFPEYQDDLFLAPDVLKAVPNIDLEIGVDGGLGNPAAIIGQQMPNGQFRNLAEVIPGRMSAKRFVAEVKREVAWLAEHSGIPTLRITRGWADPAAFNGADKEDGELAWAEQVMLGLECPLEPAPSNEIPLRLDAVRDELVIEGGIPKTMISRRCKKLRKGYASHYCYKIDKATGKAGAEAKPHKGEYSHIADADQYWKLGKKGWYGTVARGRDGQPAVTAGGGSTVIKTDYNVFG